MPPAFELTQAWNCDETSVLPVLSAYTPAQSCTPGPGPGEGGEGEGGVGPGFGHVVPVNQTAELPA